MSEEKRQTRLLPFSLRREPEGAAGGGRDAGGEDADLRALLGAWEAPAAPSGSRERLLASFRARAARPPLWKRLLTSTVPVPVAACAALALALAAYALASRPAEMQPPAAETKAEAPPSAAVRVVEVPVERVVEVPVERVVYVEKKERAVARGSKVRTVLARRDAGGGGAGAGGASEASYVTPLDMAEFQPPGALKMRVIRRGRTDEE